MPPKPNHQIPSKGGWLLDRLPLGGSRLYAPKRPTPRLGVQTAARIGLGPGFLLPSKSFMLGNHQKTFPNHSRFRWTGTLYHQITKAFIGKCHAEAGDIVSRDGGGAQKRRETPTSTAAFVGKPVHLRKDHSHPLTTLTAGGTHTFKRLKGHQEPSGTETALMFWSVRNAPSTNLNCDLWPL